ncbi:sugar phosphate isomerase/epimerase [Cohnella sp. LGH]|uniref:sugar phosphate isomerase/epimerase family protein n=1 Tax=Cohnella sp. LGH TaxID=1619153 RepID=UPI001ADCF070|nr:sugar phosphate isomerase/epimerase [Cohnella sp. LGH]QTH43140.1 sugar phosphate isomerase/epimerase [Cohnella sp. LGH]
MKLGFYGNYTPETVKFASEVGFKCMELSAWPKSSLNADTISDRRIEEIRQDLEDHDIEISTLGYYPNYLDPNKAHSEEAQRYFIKLLDLAVRMNVRTVSTFAGRNPELSVEKNIPLFKEVFSRFCEEAEKRNIRIAMENCPMMNHVTLEGLNIAYSPEIWQVLFDAVPSDALGLEIDPSHMVWQGIDYVKAIHEFGHKIFHAHAKDMEILHDVKARSGQFGTLFRDIDDLGHGWWRARTPGWGDVKWDKYITALIEVNYTGNIDIEHEDDVFAKTIDMGEITEESDIVNNYVQDRNGLILGYKTLSALIP